MNNIINYKEYIKSHYWQYIKYQVLIRDNYRCVMCGSENNLCVHHKTYDFVGDEHLDELVTLCRKCHYKIHKTNKISYEQQIYIDANNEMENERVKYYNFIENNIYKYKILLENIKLNNFISSEEFGKYIMDISNKDISFQDLLYFTMDYFDLVYIFSTKKSKLIPNTSMSNPAVVFKEFYKQSPNDIHMMGRFYNTLTVNPFEFFKQTIKSSH